MMWAFMSPRTPREQEFRTATFRCFRRHLVVLVVLLCVDSSPFQAAAADSPAVSIASVRVGIAGLYHVGAWTPLSVQLEGRAETPLQLEVEAPDPDDNVVLYRGEPQTLEGTAPPRMNLLFKTGRQQGDLVIRIKDPQGKTRAEKKYKLGDAGGEVPAPLPYSTTIWIGVGRPAGFEEPVTEPLGEHLVARASVKDLSELPLDWSGYQCIDALVVAANGSSGENSTVLEGFAADTPRADALRRWVSAGGVMLLGAGDNLDRFKTGPLGQWFPILPQSQQSIRQFSTLQAYVGKPIRYDGSVPSAVVEADQRRVVVAGAVSPLVVEAPAEFGRVFFCALDLDRDPFLKWEGLSRFYLQVLTRGLNRPDRTGNASSTNRLSHGGISDISTQLTRGASNIEGVRRTSLSGNLFYLLIYLLIIGPLDYLIVVRWLKRPEWTWVTLPLLIALAGGVGLLYARSSNGNSTRTQTLSVVDVDGRNGNLHARNWITLYSPRTGRFSVEVHPAGFAGISGTSSRLGWWGMPEASIGGLYRSPGLQFGRREYAIGPDPDRLDQTPIQIWSTRNLESEWTGQASPVVGSKLESTGVGNLQGSLTWLLDEPLQDCMLVFGNRVYFPRGKRGKTDSAELPANFVWEPSVATQTTQRELRGFLTKLQTRAVVRFKGTGESELLKDLETIASAYDPNGRNLNDILPILCFHEYAGGSGYTLLQNDVLEQMDWSHLLRLGEAVLFGRVERSPVEIKIDDRASSVSQDHRQTTFIRCALPVARVQGRDARDFASPLKKLKD